MSSPIHRNVRLAVSLLCMVPVALVIAGCPSTTAPSDGAVNACAATPRAMSFTHATFRVPSELRKLDEQGCLTSIPNEGHPFAIAQKAIDSVGKASRPAVEGDDLPPAGEVPGPPLLDWDYKTPSPTAPVTGTPALWIASFPSSDNTNDRLFYGTSTTRGANFYALNTLYSAAPSILWSATNGGMDGGAVVVNNDGTKIFALDTLGSLNCYAGATGNTCAGWGTTQAYVTGNGASLSAPWLDYATSALYFGDLAGYLYKLNANTGALIWKVNLNSFMTAPCVSGCSPFGLRGSPIFADGMVYVGNDAGVMFRVRDPGAATPTSSEIDSAWLCTSPSSPLGCGAAWSVVNGATVDTAVGGGAQAFVYAAANGVMFEFPHNAATAWARTYQVDLGTAAGYPVYSSPIVDYNNLYVYVGYYNRLHKIKYPFSATSAATSAALAGAGPDGSYPHSSPMPYSDAIFIGDGAGSSERFGCAKTSTAPVRTAQTIVYGSSVDSVPVIDFGTGNINFGYTSTGGTGGGVVQIARTASWGCSPGKSCATTACTEDQPAGGCIAATQCCTDADCGTAPANGTSACSASNDCVTTCNAGFKACGSTCIGSANCCTSADCGGATPVCSGIGGTCGSGQSITFNFKPATGSGTQSVVSTIATPVTTLTTGTATFTQDNRNVVGTGTKFLSAYQPGQSMSPDGAHFYAITSISSDTALTLTAKYPLPTQTVAAYYEADCVSGQTCPSSATYTTACTTWPCALTVALPLGDYAITAKAYNGTSGSGRVVGAVSTNAKFRMTGDTTNDLSSVNVTLPRIYPVGVTGNDARCPLDLAVDSSGNVWTVNGNGNTGSNCSGPTNNISKLVKASTYAPTVINNPAISASPEAIDADGSGNVWVTVPTLSNGIFRLNSTGAVTSGFPVGSGQCNIPRGVAVDRSSTGGSAAYVACYGSLASGAASGRKVAKWPTTGGATPAKQIDLSDATDQPVSLVVPYANGRTDGKDYACYQSVYVNRSSDARVVISRLDLNLTSVKSYVQASADQNPYGLTFDGGGTAYTVARTTGDVINVEWNGSNVILDSDNASNAAPTPWAIAADDQYPTNYTNYSCGTAIPQSDMWITHGAGNTVSRFNNNPQNPKNNYVVGSSTSPQPRGIQFDSSTDGGVSGFLWVVNSAEGSLSRIYKKLALQVASDSGNIASTACPTGVAPGSTITLSGKGFDATPANNTVLVAGYLATPTAVTVKTSPTLDTMTVKIPTDIANIVGPITVINAYGAVQTISSYTTL